MEKKNSPVIKDFIDVKASAGLKSDENIAEEIVEFLSHYPKIRNRVV